MISLDYAINAALKKSNAKIFRISENEKAYIISCAYDNGEIPVGIPALRIDKQSGKLGYFNQLDPDFFKPVTRIPFPSGYGDIFVEPKDYD